jgi:hypothetical protein
VAHKNSLRALTPFFRSINWGWGGGGHDLPIVTQQGHGGQAQLSSGALHCILRRQQISVDRVQAFDFHK